MVRVQPGEFRGTGLSANPLSSVGQVCRLRARKRTRCCPGAVPANRHFSQGSVLVGRDVNLGGAGGTGLEFGNVLLRVVGRHCPALQLSRNTAAQVRRHSRAHRCSAARRRAFPFPRRTTGSGQTFGWSRSMLVRPNVLIYASESLGYRGLLCHPGRRRIRHWPIKRSEGVALGASTRMDRSRRGRLSQASL